MKNPMTGCGPFVHNDPEDRPAELFTGTVTVHTGGDRQSYLLVPLSRPHDRVRARGRPSPPPPGSPSMMRSSTGATAASSGSGGAPGRPRRRRRTSASPGAAVRYGDLTVFEDIDLTIKDREIVSIVGPSGCGKTTLLRAVDGLTRLNSGTVTIDGKPVNGPTPGVSMVFQHFGLFPWKSVFNNVAYGLKLQGAPKEQIAEVVPKYIKMVGLAGFEKAYPHQLSGACSSAPGWRGRWPCSRTSC